MRQGLKTCWLALLNGLLLAIPLATYTTVNDFRQPNALLLFLVIISLIVVAHTQWPRAWGLWWPLYLLSLIGGSYASYPLGEPLSLTWFQHFSTKLFQQTSAFRASTSTQAMPVLLSMLLIMALAIGLSLLAVRWQQPLLSMIVSIGYLLAVTLFATRNEVWPLTGAIGLATLLLLSYRHSHWSWLSLSYGLLALGLLGAGATVNTWAQPAINQLAKASLTWRNQLSSRGFYNFLAKSAAAKKTGISEDTATLGGSIQDDNSVAFKAVSRSNHYWRVDTRDEYSGKGWTIAGDQDATRKPTTTSTGYLTTPTSKKDAVKLTFAKTLTYLPVGYGATSWAVSAAQQKRIGVSYEPERGRIYLNTGKRPLTSVQVHYQPQKYTAAQLTAITARANAELTETYTQLPEDLPKRIKPLSQKLTKTQTTEYGRVHAILTYLKNNHRFEYTKIDTPTTPAKRDYVDYFLFTSRRGYCDNFSTAMVVMLRTLGIPTRWAHGFSGGTRGKKAGDGQYHYQILNSDAHSWAEVYFAGIGWVPFDPTPGYQNPGTKAAKEKAAKTASISSSSSSATTNSTSSHTSQATASSSKPRPTNQTSTSTTTKQPTHQFRLTTTWLHVSLGILGLLLILFVWLGRFWLGLMGLNLMLHWHLGRPTQHYRYLQAWFEHQHARRPAETLSDYADTVEQLWPALAGQFTNATTTYLAITFGDYPADTLPAQLQAVVTTLRQHRKPIPV